MTKGETGARRCRKKVSPAEPWTRWILMLLSFRLALAGEPPPSSEGGIFSTAGKNPAPSDEGAVSALGADWRRDNLNPLPCCPGPPRGTPVAWGEEEPLAIRDLPLAANPGLAMRALTKSPPLTRGVARPCGRVGGRDTLKIFAPSRNDRLHCLLLRCITDAARCYKKIPVVLPLARNRTTWYNSINGITKAGLGAVSSTPSPYAGDRSSPTQQLSAPSSLYPFVCLFTRAKRRVSQALCRGLSCGVGNFYPLRRFCCSGGKGLWAVEPPQAGPVVNRNNKIKKGRHGPWQSAAYVCSWRWRRYFLSPLRRSGRKKWSRRKNPS